MTETQRARWALIVHGGAKPWPAGEEEEHRAGVLDALAQGREVLEAGGSALDAVEAAVRRLEDLPAFNAGTGSSLNERGEAEMCSGIMDGGNYKVGAVGAIRMVRNPVSVARAMLPEQEVLIVGEGAGLFADRHGIERVPNEALVVEKRKKELAEHDTVGAVALDSGGNIAAATSTGGLAGAPVGRIGDSPVPGGGFYADNHVGGVAFSGDGETIQRLATASRVMAAIEAGKDAEQAIADALARLPGTGGAGADGGGIAITKDGRVAWAHNSPSFSVAMITSEMDSPQAWLSKEEATRD